jgi:transposase, IS5 family
MSQEDFFRARLEHMIDLAHPLAVLAQRLPWAQIESTLAPLFEHETKPLQSEQVQDLLGEHEIHTGGNVSPAGRPRLPVRLMASLVYLKHSFNLSDEALVERWSENVVWQYFSGLEYYEPRLPCDATQIGRFRRDLGKDGLEQLLKFTLQTAVDIKAVKPTEFERIIVDTTVQEKAIAYPVDSRLLEIARYKVVQAAKHAGIALKQTYAKEGKTLRRKAGGYAHARQMKRLNRTVKRQRTILGVVIREVKRKLATAVPDSALALPQLKTILERAERIRTQQRHDKNKLYALHAPEVECISKGKARQRYEFGVKVSLAVTHQQGLMVGALSCPGNPYDGHTLEEQLKQTNRLIADTERTVKQAVVDLAYRGVDGDNPGIQIIHRGKASKLTQQHKRWLRRRQAIEPGIGHLKQDHRMNRCYLPGALGDALNALCSAVGYNLRWLMRAVVRLKPAAVFLRLIRATESLAHSPRLSMIGVVRVLALRYSHALSCRTVVPIIGFRA